MRNSFLTTTAVVALTISAITAQAHLGWTLAECKQHYGKLTKAPEAADAGRRIYTFVNKGFRIEVYFPKDDDSASRVVYVRNFPVNFKQIHILMDDNAPDVSWSDPIKNADASGDHHFVGTVNEEVTNYAEVDSLCEMFAIWTVADDTAMILSKKRDAKDTQAGLGWTLSECEEHYGQPTARAQQEPGDKLFYKFANNEYEIGVDIHNGTVCRVMYHRFTGFDLAGVEALLESNAPEATWTPYKDGAHNGNCFNGIVNGETAYYAGVTENNALLVIWTKADNDVVNSANNKGETSDR